MLKIALLAAGCASLRTSGPSAGKRGAAPPLARARAHASASASASSGAGALGELQAVSDIDDPRLALYRSRVRRDHELYHQQTLSLASDALLGAGFIDEEEGRRLKEGPWVRRELRKLQCVVSVHYTWDCLKQLAAAREDPKVAAPCFVGSALLPTGTPDELVELVRRVSPVTFVVERGLFEPEFAQDMDPEFGQERRVAEQVSDLQRLPTRAVWRRFEGGAANSTVRYAVAFPLTAPLASMRPPFVVLDNLTSASNIGQILRTAYHFGVTSVVTSKASWNSLNGRACRVSMGWFYRMSFHVAEESLPDTLEELKRTGVRIYAAENQFAEPVAPHSPAGDRRWALVMGHEGLGISREVVAVSDACVRIPQEQGLCLNVAHAASICLYELSRGHGGC